jgi:PIN domain nuclease of toxin-antitoxin system
MVTEAPMPVIIDTHTFMWYLQDDRKLSKPAGEVLDAVTAAGDPIFVSAATAVELQYLRDKGKITEDEYGSYVVMLESAADAIEVAPVDLGVARAIERVPRDVVPDPFDRMIAATAVALGVPLVTCDRKLRALPAVETIW